MIAPVSWAYATNEYLVNIEIERDWHYDYSFFHHPPRISINSATNTIYISYLFSNDIHVVNTENNSIKTIDYDMSPFELEVNPKTNMIYVANHGGIIIIDGSTNTVTQDFELWKCTLRHLYGEIEYCANVPQDKVLSIDYQDVAVNPDTNRIYAITVNGDHVLVISVDKMQPEKIIELDDRFFERIDVNPKMNLIYLTRDGDSRVFVIDGSTNQLIKKIDTGTYLYDIHVNPNTNRIYAGISGQHTTAIIVVDGLTNEKLESIILRDNAVASWTINPKNNMVYVATEDSASGYKILIIDGLTHQIVKEIPVSIKLQQIAVDTKTGTIYGTAGSTKSITLAIIKNPIDEKTAIIPLWVKNNAKWWSEGSVSDSDFVQGIQYLIKEKIMKIPETKSSSSVSSQQIPSWVKNNAGWWSDGKISDDDFIKGIQYLVEKGMIRV